ncbi:PDR/VanB family oxidoreductase [Arthrobacter sp. UYEF3]|uniref:PDR/VanB family oxidoreductase n=1 Tax=Arthrobacter sp. UYEF3 TaxID=1756365 RepID=UPI0033973FB7
MMLTEVTELKLAVVRIVPESAGVLSLVLENPGTTDLLPVWDPGAHIEVEVPGVGPRHYSLNSDPQDRRTWRISVLRSDNGRGGSVALHGVFPGSLLAVRGPRNNFPLADTARLLLIGGGIGITPLLPMLRQAEREGRDWQLLYSGRSRDSMAFLSELAPYGDRVRIFANDDGEFLDLAAELAEPTPDMAVHCCGPTPMLDAAKVATAHWPTGSLRLERFAAVPAVILSADRPFEVLAARSGVSTTVPVGCSILDSLEAAGIRPTSSCREGICGTCETPVLEGIPQHRDSLLTEEERATNKTMIICVGRAATDRLVLDL